MALKIEDKQVEVIVFDKDGTLISFDFWIDVMFLRLKEFQKRYRFPDTNLESPFLEVLGVRKKTEGDGWEIIPDGNVFKERLLVVEDIFSFFQSYGKQNISKEDISHLLADVDQNINYQDLIKPVFPDLKEFLSRLHLEVQMGIATGDILYLVDEFIKKFALEGLFSAIATSDIVNLPKPDKAYLEYIARKLSVTDFKHILMVGDSPGDIILGKSCGALTAAVLTGRFSFAQAQKYKPDFIWDSIADIKGYLKN